MFLCEAYPSEVSADEEKDSSDKGIYDDCDDGVLFFIELILGNALLHIFRRKGLVSEILTAIKSALLIIQQYQFAFTVSIGASANSKGYHLLRRTKTLAIANGAPVI